MRVCSIRAQKSPCFMGLAFLEAQALWTKSGMYLVAVRHAAKPTIGIAAVADTKNWKLLCELLRRVHEDPIMRSCIHSLIPALGRTPPR